MASGTEVTAEMRMLMATLKGNGPMQFNALINDALRQSGIEAPNPMDRDNYFFAFQQCLAEGLIVYGADLQRPTWPWVSLSIRGSERL
jgi:hypothetical protein